MSCDVDGKSTAWLFFTKMTDHIFYKSDESSHKKVAPQEAMTGEIIERRLISLRRIAGTSDGDIAADEDSRSAAMFWAPERILRVCYTCGTEERCAKSGQHENKNYL